MKKCKRETDSSCRIILRYEIGRQSKSGRKCEFISTEMPLPHIPTAGDYAAMLVANSFSKIHDDA